LPAVDSALRDGSALIFIPWRQHYDEVMRWESVEERIEFTPEEEDPYSENPYANEMSALIGPQRQGDEEEDDDFEVLDEGDDSVSMTLPGAGAITISRRRQLVKRTILTYDAPEIVVFETGFVPGTNKARWGTYPARNANLQRSMGVYMRWEATGDTLLQRVKSGVFSKDAVELLWKRTLGSSEAYSATSIDQLEQIDTSTESAEEFQWRTFSMIDLMWRIPVRKSKGRQRSIKGRSKRLRRRLITISRWRKRQGLYCKRGRSWEVWAHGRAPVVLVRPIRRPFRGAWCECAGT
jgi:hypothetical protein